MSAVRAFLTQVRAFEPETEIPPNIFRSGRRRRRPYLFSGEELSRLMQAPHQLRLFDALRPLMLVTLMGLLASAGLRIGEALRLTLDDAKLEADPPHLLILDTKFGKSRVVVLHPSTVALLLTMYNAGARVSEIASLRRQHVVFGPTCYAHIPRIPVSSMWCDTAKTAMEMIGIGGHLTMPPLPHHRAYGSVPRRFGQLSGHGVSRYGRPSESKNCPGSAQQSALVRVTRHGPRLLRAVRMASFALTPRFRNSRKRVPGRVHCFQTTARSRRRIHLSRRRRIVGVSQKPKYARHPRRYAASSCTICWRLTPRTRRVSFRTRAFNRSNVLSARRRFGRWPWVKLKPRNVRSRAAATALFATLTLSFSRVVMKSVILAITRCPARALRTYTLQSSA